MPYSTTPIIVSGSLPTGIIQIFAGDSSSVPIGFLLCDGSAVSRDTYRDLFAVIGENYGAGDGSTTFNLPDLQLSFPMGADTANPIGTTGGEAAHVLTVDEIPSHNHSVRAYVNGPATGYIASSNGTGTASTATTTSIGGDEAHNNLPPYVCINYIIKT